MQPLTITKSTIIPFSCALVRPFTFAGNIVTERTGYYLEALTTDGLTAKGEIAPLPGVSSEPLKKAKHDLEGFQPFLSRWQVPLDQNGLIVKVRKDEHLSACCPSVRFGIESVLFLLAAQANGVSLQKFLGASADNVPSAALLQGTHEQTIAQARQAKQEGCTVFKLKVGDRNIALDVKKVQDLRAVIGKDGLIRLDGNRVWSLSEAILFAQLAGPGQIEFIEEPLSDAGKLNEFYEAAHMPIALDENLGAVMGEGVKAYVIKPMVLGGIVNALDWIEKAHGSGKKAVISSAFESPVGLSVLKALACLTGQISGLGTERWLKI